MTTVRCSDLSEAAGESLSASATTAVNWLLVEVPGAWPRDVAERGALAPESHETLAAWVEETPESRLLFIRRPGRTGGRRLVFAVRASEGETQVRRIELDASAALAELDPKRDGEIVDRQLVVVCGHGTRDACCALRGGAVFGALASHVEPDDLWLSTHQGGHRFAANVLVLPSGLHLGRLDPENAVRVVRDALAGRIALEHYRGRTAYTQRQQAAERVVRESGGLVGVGDLSLVEDDGERVRFVDRDGQAHAAVPAATDGPSVPASCGAQPEPQRHVTAQLSRARPSARTRGR